MPEKIRRKIGIIIKMKGVNKQKNMMQKKSEDRL